MDLHLIVDAPTLELKDVIPAGSVVRYEGHIVGGMIRVTFNGVIYVIHPDTTKELRDQD